MANTAAAAGLTVKQWDDKFFREYVRENRFQRYFGEDEGSIIQIKKDLMKKKGDQIVFALVNKLANDGVTGDTLLEGSEEKLKSRSHSVTVNQLRNAVVVGNMEEQRSAIALRDAARVQLKEWMMDKMRSSILTALASIDGTAYASASEASKDAWLANNSDRVLFGVATSNNSANDHSASLANIDNTNDKLTAATLGLIKRLAKAANPIIRPIRLKEDEEWYVLFANSRAFRDLKLDTNFISANRDARERGKDNPLFTGDDLIYDGVIIREIPEIAYLTGVGAGSIDVGPCYLCGAQALGLAWAQTSKTASQEFDYGNKVGVAIGEIRGVEKLRFGTDSAVDTTTPKDNGVVTFYGAAVAD
jgi:N4-gp56 family major capsid protein